ncbi:MAG: recombinase family protein [Armatimonadetes bacterium]|nr:recombinase family protein [Armatimonadota bacterium]
MRIAIYARKSEEREDRQVQSLEDQIRELTRLAKKEGHTLVEVFQEARSAMEPFNRPEFDRLMLGFEQGAFDAVYVWSVNRLARNDWEGGKVSHFLRRGKIAFIRAIDRTFLPSDNALILSVEMGMSVAYVQKLQIDVARGMRGKVERGWHTCKAPVGYRNDPESREILVDSDRFPLVRKGWDLVIDGKHSLAEIHRMLQKLGLSVRTKNGVTKPISYARLIALFREPFYMGQIVFMGETYPGKHQPMVSAAEFEIAQERLNHKVADRRPIKRSMPFAGAMKCGVCGCSVVGEVRHKEYRKTGNSATYIYYHCSGSKGCPKRGVSQDYLQGLFEDRIERIAIPETTANWLKDALVQCSEADLATVASSLTNLETDERLLTTRLDRLMDMRLDGEIDPGAYRLRKDRIESKLLQLKTQKERATNREQLALRVAYEQLDRAIEAESWMQEERNLATLGKLMPLVGQSTLTLGKLQIELHPILREIAAFEPLQNGSERPQRGDSVPKSSVWWALVRELRKISLRETACE